MKKRISMLLVLAALLSSLSVFSSCAKDEAEETSVTAAPAVEPGETAAETEAETEPEKSALEAAIEKTGVETLGGASVKIMSPNPGKHFYYHTSAEENELYYDESASEVLSSAIYTRNSMVEKALDVKLEPVWGNDTGDISSVVKANVTAGDSSEFDAAINRLDYSINNALAGELLNFYNVPGMDMENEWWDRPIVDTFTIGGNKLCTLAGDLNYYDDYAVEMVLFNKKMLADYGTPTLSQMGYDDLYGVVRDGKWTVDLMVTLGQLASTDLDGDRNMVLNKDIIGIGDNYDVVFHFLFSYGQKASENDENGYPQPNAATEGIVNAVEDIAAKLTDPLYTSMNTWENATPFKNNLMLFYCEMVGIIPKFRDMETDFGVLPMPKGAEDMDGYKAYVSNGWTTVYQIPSFHSYEDAGDIGKVLECMSAASSETVTPALYEQLLEAKYIRDAESKEMLEYVFGSKVYDWAGDLAWAGALRNCYNGVLTSGADGFVSSIEKIQKPTTKQLERLVESFEKIN